MIVYSLIINTPLGESLVEKVKERSSEKTLDKFILTEQIETEEEVSEYRIPILRDKAEKYGEINARSSLSGWSRLVDTMLGIFLFMFLSGWTQEVIPGILGPVVSLSIVIIFFVIIKDLSSKQEAEDERRKEEILDDI